MECLDEILLKHLAFLRRFFVYGNLRQSNFVFDCHNLFVIDVEVDKNRRMGLKHFSDSVFNPLRIRPLIKRDNRRNIVSDGIGILHAVHVNAALGCAERHAVFLFVRFFYTACCPIVHPVFQNTVLDIGNA